MAHADPVTGNCGFAPDDIYAREFQCNRYGEFYTPPDPLPAGAAENRKQPAWVSVTSTRPVISASVALNGETPESARVQLTDLIERAVLNGPLSDSSRAVVTSCVFELSTVHASDTTGRSDTDFSRLLDF